MYGRRLFVSSLNPVRSGSSNVVLYRYCFCFVKKLVKIVSDRTASTGKGVTCVSRLPFEQRLLNRLFDIKRFHTMGSLFTAVFFSRFFQSSCRKYRRSIQTTRAIENHV